MEVVEAGEISKGQRMRLFSASLETEGGHKTVNSNYHEQFSDRTIENGLRLMRTEG
jgi:hypothetical protein